MYASISFNDKQDVRVVTIAYRTCTIISQGLYFFTPFFTVANTYCRAAYTAEWLIFHDSFFPSQSCKLTFFNNF